MSYKIHPGSMMALAGLLGGGSHPVRYSVAIPTPTQAELERSTRHKAEALEAARQKRLKKLARYTDTPQARARLAEIEADPRLKPWPLPVCHPCREIIF